MFTMKFSTDNAAFDDEAHEVSRILKEVAAQVERGSDYGTVRDVNGNTIGEWSF